MKKYCIGDKLQIQCYKHNGKIHRAWDAAVFLDEQKDYLVFGNLKTLVTEAEGNTWRTKEPAIMYYFKNEWYNIICQLKKDGIYYYCNIATPFIIEENTIKYIDYDLDLRIFPNKEYRILDKMEYKYHQKIMNYSKELDKAIKNGLSKLIFEYKNNAIYFNEKVNREYCQQYMNIKDRKK